LCPDHDGNWVQVQEIRFLWSQLIAVLGIVQGINHNKLGAGIVQELSSWVRWTSLLVVRPVE
jgi:hypothetical protein